MKKSVFKILSIVTFCFVTLTLSNCGSEEPDIIIEPTGSAVIENLNSGIMNGNLDEDFTLNPSQIYNLNGSFIIEAGATLTIPAGTRIQAFNGGTDVFIAVLKSGFLNII